MSYVRVHQEASVEDVVGTKEVELGGVNETDIEASPGTESEESSLLNWKYRNHSSIHAQSMFQKIFETNVPLIISVHFLVFNLILSIALGSLLFKNFALQSVASIDTHPPGELLYTIGEDVIEHRVERAYVGPGYSEGYVPSAYQGWPNDENDALWRKYEDGNHIRLSKGEADKLLHETERVPLEKHKDEYMVGIVVFHHLHCLSAIRRAFYPKRYNTSMFHDDGRVNYVSWHHVDHCIEILRTYLECHPETTAMPFQWVPDSTLAVHPTTLHTCRNFDVISNWVYERSVEVPIRSHYENGWVVDYTGRPFGKQYNETWVMEIPADFFYTKDDMV